MPQIYIQNCELELGVDNIFFIGNEQKNFIEDEKNIELLLERLHEFAPIHGIKINSLEAEIVDDEDFIIVTVHLITSDRTNIDNWINRIFGNDMDEVFMTLNGFGLSCKGQKISIPSKRFSKLG